jgi:hypothetical protein
LAAVFEQRRSAQLLEAPLLDMNYGLGDYIQLKLEVGWITLHEDDGTKGGLGNSQIGVKWRFLDEGPEGFAASIYPQFEFNNPTSSDERGLVDPGYQLVLPMQIARSVGPVEASVEAR